MVDIEDIKEILIREKNRNGRLRILLKKIGGMNIIKEY